MCPALTVSCRSPPVICPLLNRQNNWDQQWLLYHNTGCGCVTSHGTAAASGDYRSSRWAICAYTQPTQHLPANPHAHPASVFDCIKKQLRAEKYTKTDNLQNRGLSLKCLRVWVFGSKGYFSLTELQKFQLKFLLQFFPVSALNTWSFVHMHIPVPCTEGFFFVCFFNYPFYARMINCLCLFLVTSLLQKILFQ